MDAEMLQGNTDHKLCGKNNCQVKKGIGNASSLAYGSAEFLHRSFIPSGSSDLHP